MDAIIKMGAKAIEPAPLLILAAVSALAASGLAVSTALPAPDLAASTVVEVPTLLVSTALLSAAALTISSLVAMHNIKFFKKKDDHLL